MQVFLIALYVGFIGLLLVAATFTLGWMLYAWRGPQAHKGLGFAPTKSRPALSFSLIVPARHEEAVLGATLEGLSRITHPSFEVLVVVGDDDSATMAIAEDASRNAPDLIRVVVDHGSPKNKPKALNTALPYCRNEIVGVFDAEDDVHPGLLSAVDHHFQATGSDVVQGGVQLMDYQSHWYSAHNALEYVFWFKSRLHFHADYGFVPLGGNTVFVKRDLITAARGWDESCLAEDCELGIRLSAEGAKISVCFDPDLVTREETPATTAELSRQRTRWNQGFLQVLRKGRWRELPLGSQRRLAQLALSLPFFQALVAVFIPVSLVMILFVEVPVWLALLSFLPLIPTLGAVSIQLVGLGDFGRTYGPKARLRDYASLVLAVIPYQLVLAYSAARAVLRESRGIGGWEQTIHHGTHRRIETDIVIDLTDESVASQASERDRSDERV